MSATLAPYGFRPLRLANDSGIVVPYTLRGGIASGYAANIGIGDPVTALTGGTFQLAAAGEVASAVFAGWLSDDGGQIGKGANWVSGQTWTIAPWFWFYRVEGTIFGVQAAGSLAQTSLWDAADHVAGTPNTRSGMSTATLSTTLAGVGASAGFKIIGLQRTVGNAWGDTYTEVEVMVNEPGLAFTPGNAI